MLETVPRGEVEYRLQLAHVRSYLGWLKGGTNLLCGMQVLHPWRRIFQQMFNHDRMAGPLYCMWNPDLSTNHPVVTQLGARCRAATDDYAAWQALLINTLDMQVSLAVVAHFGKQSVATCVSCSKVLSVCTRAVMSALTCLHASCSHNVQEPVTGIRRPAYNKCIHAHA